MFNRKEEHRTSRRFTYKRKQSLEKNIQVECHVHMSNFPDNVVCKKKKTEREVKKKVYKKRIQNSFHKW